MNVNYSVHGFIHGMGRDTGDSHGTRNTGHSTHSQSLALAYTRMVGPAAPRRAQFESQHGLSLSERSFKTQNEMKIKKKYTYKYIGKGMQ